MHMAQSHTVRRIARMLVVAVVACCALVASGCSSAYPSVEEALRNGATSTLGASDTLEAGVLTVGVNANNAPYAWRSSSGDEIQGIDVDSALALADAMGLKAKFVDVGADYEAATNGLCDVVMGVTSSQVPASEVLVGNYLESAPAVFGRNVVATATVADLSVATVAVRSDSVAARALSAAVPTATLVPYDTLNDAFAALEGGQVQYVACDSLMGGYLATAYDDVSFAGALALPDMRGVAIPASNAALQAAVQSGLDAITSNGVLRVVREDWVGDLPSITTSNQVA